MWCWWYSSLAALQLHRGTPYSERGYRGSHHEHQVIKHKLVEMDRQINATQAWLEISRGVSRRATRQQLNWRSAKYKQA